MSNTKTITLRIPRLINLNGVFIIRNSKYSYFDSFGTNNPFSLLVSEFDNYITIANDMPWWYNERPCISFFTSGIVRKHRNVVILEEFKSDRINNTPGRADLAVWIKRSNKCTLKYLVESKYWRCDVSADGGKWKNEWENNTLQQALIYNIDNYYNFIMSICFRSMWCTDINAVYSSIHRNGWGDINSAIQSGLDFYGFYYLKKEKIDKFDRNTYQIDGYAHIGVAISGMIIKGTP
jgi:hypothetical protein